MPPSPAHETVTIAAVSDLAALFGISIATAHTWRRPWGVTKQSDPRVYTPAKGALSIFGERLANVSSTDVWDVDLVIENVRAARGLACDQKVLRRLREQASMPTRMRIAGRTVPLIPAGLVELGIVLGIDKRVIAVMDGRGQLPDPIALVGSGTPLRVYATWQVMGDPRYSQERAERVARVHRLGADAEHDAG